MLSSDEIRDILPHRYPFIMVDKIIELEPGKRVVGVKNVSSNEYFFQGHFPSKQIMPGVLIVEALAQTAGIAIAVTEENKNKLGVLASIEAMKFKKNVVPGDVLKLEAEIVSFRMNVAKASVRATVEGKTAAEGEIRFAMVTVE